MHVGIALTNITSGGDFDVTADVVVTDGGISSARIITSGPDSNGVGDVLGIGTKTRIKWRRFW